MGWELLKIIIKKKGLSSRTDLCVFNLFKNVVYVVLLLLFYFRCMNDWNTSFILYIRRFKSRKVTEPLVKSN